MNYNALSNFLTPIGFGSFGDIGDGAYVPLQDIDNTFQYAGIMSYTKWNHSLRLFAGRHGTCRVRLRQGNMGLV